MKFAPGYHQPGILCNYVFMEKREWQNNRQEYLEQLAKDKLVKEANQIADETVANPSNYLHETISDALPPPANPPPPPKMGERPN